MRGMCLLEKPENLRFLAQILFAKKKTIRGWSYNHPSDGKGLKVNKRTQYTENKHIATGGVLFN